MFRHTHTCDTVPAIKTTPITPETPPAPSSPIRLPADTLLPVATELFFARLRDERGRAARALGLSHAAEAWGALPALRASKPPLLVLSSGHRLARSPLVVACICSWTFGWVVPCFELP